MKKFFFAPLLSLVLQIRQTQNKYFFLKTVSDSPHENEGMVYYLYQYNYSLNNNALVLFLNWKDSGREQVTHLQPTSENSNCSKKVIPPNTKCHLTPFHDLWINSSRTLLETIQKCT